MVGKVVVSERELLDKLQCPLRGGELGIAPEFAVLHCAERTADWLIRERFHGNGVTLRQVHDFFDHQWQQFRDQVRANLPPAAYNRRVLSIGRACRRLRDLVGRFEIIQPVESYSLSVGNVVVSGEYAVLRSEKRKRRGVIAYLRDGGLRVRPLVPDVVSFSRWLDLVNRDAAFSEVAVLNYWVTTDLAAEHQPEHTFATDLLLGATSMATGNPFPVTGEHCLSCQTRACRPDLKPLSPEVQSASLFTP